MKKTLFGSVAGCAMLAAAGCAMSGGSDGSCCSDGADTTKCAVVAKNPALDKFRALEGKWESKEAGPDGKKMVVTYNTTSAGSAVCETLFPGSDHEMVTMYVAAGNDIYVTHYCAMGNQPRMRARDAAGKSDLLFTYVDGCNITDPKKDTYMGEARFEFVSADHIKTHWWSIANGQKDAEHAPVFDLVRVR